MSVKGAEYHRTFMRYGGTGRMPTAAEWAKISRNLARRPATVPRTSMGAPSGSEKDTRKFHDAVQISGSQFTEIPIWEKDDQKFDQFATPWERKFSRLVTHNRGTGFQPVVDGNATVVGHHGIVKGNRILIGRGTGVTLVYTPAETLKYHRMYVGSTSLHSGADLSVFGSEWHFYSVLTDIYGEVTGFEFSHKSNNGTVESVSLPSIGWLRVLFHGGMSIFMSARNGFRSLGRQPALPAPVPTRALPPGKPTQPTSAPAGNATRPGSQTVVSQGAGIPVPRPRQVYDTDLGTAIQNVRHHLGLPPLPARTVAQLHYIARGRRADKELHEWLLANPNASWPEKFEMMNRIYARWRVRGMPGEE